MSDFLAADSWSRLQEVFESTSSLAPEQRKAYLDGLCADEPELRAKVETLLQANDSSASINDMLGVVAASALESALPLVGSYIGPYRIIETLGRGGMGVVYRAVRADDEYRKEAAIKIASTGLLTPELRQHFLDERQILANLDHPNIARLLDGGTTEGGIPYVVMEFVSGKPIDIYCDESHLNRGQRIRLAIEVARAVDYAHRHLVVHRDLKPDNIYVTAEGVPKLLDFGIAKALDSQIFERPSSPDGTFTANVSHLLTPDYASPEQVRGEPVTTATDVYQLGILLYVLLTSRRPFPFTSGDMLDLKRAICESLPPRPNLDRDLDEVLLKALAKEPQNRYTSAGDLADDLERWLNGFPVQARPTSWSYRTRKLILRHKLMTGVAAVGLLVLLGFITALAIQVRRVRHERDVAQKVASFLTNLFSAVNPEIARGHTLTARQLLDQATENINKQDFSDPQVADQLLVALAQSYKGLGDYDRAASLFEQSLKIREQLYGLRSKQVADALGNMALTDMQSENFAALTAILPRWSALTQSLTGSSSSATAAVLGMESANDTIRGHLIDAEQARLRSIAIDSRTLGANNPSVIEGYGFLGYIEEYRGEDALAERSYRKVLNLLQHGNWQDSPAVTGILDLESKLGYVLTEEGRYAEAEPLLHQSLELRRKILGPRHNLFANSEICMGFLDASTGRYSEAEALIRDALSIHTAVLGAGSLFAGGDMDELARLYLYQGKYSQAVPYLRAALANMSSRVGEHGESPYFARVLYHLGEAQLGEKQYAQASDTLARALAMETRLNGEASPYAANDYRAIGELLAAQDKLPEAELNLRHALHIYQASAAVYRPGLAQTLQALAALLEKEGKNREGHVMRQEADTLSASLAPYAKKALSAASHSL